MQCLHMKYLKVVVWKCGHFDLFDQIFFWTRSVKVQSHLQILAKFHKHKRFIVCCQ